MKVFNEFWWLLPVVDFARTGMPSYCVTSIRSAHTSRDALAKIREDRQTTWCRTWPKWPSVAGRVWAFTATTITRTTAQESETTSTFLIWPPATWRHSGLLKQTVDVRSASCSCSYLYCCLCRLIFLLSSSQFRCAPLFVKKVQLDLIKSNLKGLRRFIGSVQTLKYPTSRILDWLTAPWVVWSGRAEQDLCGPYVCVCVCIQCCHQLYYHHLVERGF